MAYRKFSDLLREEATERSNSETLAGLATLAGGQADTRDGRPDATLAGLATLAAVQAHAREGGDQWARASGARADAPKQQQRYLFDNYRQFFVHAPNTAPAHGTPHGQTGTSALAPAAAKAAKVAKAPPEALQAWIEGCRGLSATPPPAISPARWSRIVDAADRFVSRWGEAALVAGWSTLDAFGCHPERPDVRFDCMGLVLLLDRCRIVTVDETGADLLTDSGARQRYRLRPLPAHTIPLWELKF